MKKASKSKWLRGAKCVTVHDGKFYSYMFEANIRVHYPLKRITRPDPNCGPLAVFSSEEKAWSFLWNDCSGFSSNGVAPCLYKKDRYGTFLFLDNGETRSDLPEGTVLAECVKLTGKPILMKDKSL